MEIPEEDTPLAGQKQEAEGLQLLQTESKVVSKGFLVATFSEMRDNITLLMDEMTADESYLRIFEKDEDPYSYEWHAMEDKKIFFLHLYLQTLKKKNWGGDFPYQDTPLTNLFDNVVTLKHRNDILQPKEEDGEDDSNCGSVNTDEEEDWDNQCLQNTITNMLPEQGLEEDFNDFRNSYRESDNSNDSDDSDDSGYEKETKQTKKKVDDEPAQLYSHIAYGEYTLIQSHDDLMASKCLFENGYNSQSVFMSSQSVEKSLKSLLKIFKCKFEEYIHNHDANQLLNQMYHHTYDSPYYESMSDLCYRFEMIGRSNIGRTKALSIRSIYFESDAMEDYYYDSFPGLVFTSDLANEAFNIAEKLFLMCETIHEEFFFNFHTQKTEHKNTENDN